MRLDVRRARWSKMEQVGPLRVRAPWGRIHPPAWNSAGLACMRMDWPVAQPRARWRLPAEQFDEGIPRIPLGQRCLSGGRIRYQQKGEDN